MSPALFAGVERGGVFAKAYGVEKNGSLWEVYPEMTSATQAASTTRRSGRIPTCDETHRGISPEAAVSGIAHISGPTRFSISGPTRFSRSPHAGPARRRPASIMSDEDIQKMVAQRAALARRP